MVTNISSVSRQLIVSLAGLFVAVLLATMFSMIAPQWFASRAFAASQHPTAETICAQAPTQTHCDGQDPEQQGCAADAITLSQADIVEHGVTIGSVERRFSLACQSWWGRVFDIRSGSQANMFIAIAGTTISASPTFVDDRYRILYSSMVFDPTFSQAPVITGSLAIDGIAPPQSTTLPAITLPLMH